MRPPELKKCHHGCYSGAPHHARSQPIPRLRNDDERGTPTVQCPHRNSENQHPKRRRYGGTSHAGSISRCGWRQNGADDGAAVVLAMVNEGLVALAFDYRDHLNQLARLADRFADQKPDLAFPFYVRRYVDSRGGPVQRLSLARTPGGSANTVSGTSSQVTDVIGKTERSLLPPWPYVGFALVSARRASAALIATAPSFIMAAIGGAATSGRTSAIQTTRLPPTSRANTCTAAL